MPEFGYAKGRIGESIQMFNGQKALLIKLLSRILETIKEKHCAT